MLKNKKFLISVFVFVIIASVSFLYFKTSKTDAAGGSGIPAVQTKQLYGNAWSPNIGWIFFNKCNDPNDPSTCSYGSNHDDNKVVLNSDSDPICPRCLIGYAWAPNVGWIEFGENQIGPSSIPLSSQKQAQIDSSGKMTGWARVWSMESIDASQNYDKETKAGVTNDYADGWINFSGSAANGTSSYGVSFAPNGTANPSSYAWGSKVTGWIDMRGVKLTPGTIASPIPNVTLGAYPPIIAKGQSSILKWTGTNLVNNTSTTTSNGCLLNGGTFIDAWEPSPDSTSLGGVDEGIKVTFPTAGTFPFNIRCKGVAGSDPEWSERSFAVVTVNENAINPTVALKADGNLGSTNVSLNSSSILSWSGTDLINDIKGCVLNGGLNGAIFSGELVNSPSSPVGGISTGSLSKKGIYPFNIKCLGIDGTTWSNLSEVKINVGDNIGTCPSVDLQARQGWVPEKASSNLFWSGTNLINSPNGCTLSGGSFSNPKPVPSPSSVEDVPTGPLTTGTYVFKISCIGNDTSCLPANDSVTVISGDNVIPGEDSCVYDGEKGEKETGIDCGGPDCPPCKKIPKYIEN